MLGIQNDLSNHFCCVFRCDYMILYFISFPSKALDFNLKCHLKEKKKGNALCKIDNPTSVSMVFTVPDVLAFLCLLFVKFYSG